MVRQLMQHALSARFFAFVLITMIGSLLAGGAVAGLAASVMAGDPALMLFIPVATVIGGGLAIPVAILLWYVPSALIFSGSMALLEKHVGPCKAAQWSGFLTALAAAIMTTYVATDFGQDADGVGRLLFVIGLVAIVIAPWAARKAYGVPKS